MRIRSIRPEFWTSLDVARLDWHSRLIFIGLWSYVDDNGVGRDLEALITAALFPLDDDLSECSLRVHGALKLLETGGQITRYTVAGKAYLHITAWDEHQKINRPSGSRYPLPTCDDAQPSPMLSEPSVSPQRTLNAGEGEKGRRGEGEKSTHLVNAARDDAPATTTPDDPFDEFWTTYPRRTAKAAARTAWAKARKTTPAQRILDGAHRYAEDPNRDPAYTPHPATWLNAGRWDDEPLPARTNGHQRDRDQLFARALARAEAADRAQDAS